MRISDVDFILVPEWRFRPTATDSDDDHWISRWARNIPSARWLEGDLGDPVAALAAQARDASRPVVVVTHGRGVDVLLDASLRGLSPAIAGAFIVAPAPAASAIGRGGPEEPLKLLFPSMMIVPDNHPEFDPRDAQNLAGLIGCDFVDAGATGRIDARSGHGPWPEGLMRLGSFLKKLSAH